MSDKIWRFWSFAGMLFYVLFFINILVPETYIVLVGGLYTVLFLYCFLVFISHVWIVLPIKINLFGFLKRYTKEADSDGIT